jgi:hypothetical protein
MTTSHVISVILKLQFKAKNMKWRDEYCIREKIGVEAIVEVEMEVAANLVSHSQEHHGREQVQYSEANILSSSCDLLPACLSD